MTDFVTHEGGPLITPRYALLSLRELRERVIERGNAGVPAIPTMTVALVLIDAVQAAQDYLIADDDDPDLGEKFAKWLRVMGEIGV